MTTLVALFATNELKSQVASSTATDQTATLAEFSNYLQALGTGTFGGVVDDLNSALVAQFSAAYGAGLAAAIAIMGGVTVIASVVAWLGMGRSEAVVSVWEHRDERGVSPATATRETSSPA